MTAPQVLPLDAPVGTAAVQLLLPHLQRALDGDGPAILPVPTGPEQVRNRLLAAADPGSPLEHGDLALIVPTSGTTGDPKLALLSRQALVAAANATHDALGGPGRWLLMMPTTHVAGLQVLIRSILAGFPPVVVDLSDGFRPQGLVDAAATLLNDIGPEPRYTALVPTQLQRILDAGGAAVAALMALDAVLLGGSAPSPELVGRAHDAGITLVQSYGMTETCGGCVYDGVPLDGVSVTIGVERRIEIAGAMLFSGYRGLPDLTSSTLRAGRFLTSDLGRFDEHGRLHIVGRADDVVITGGVNVSCYIVERVLASHPAIHEVAVVGVLDSEWGERLVAIAVTGETLQLEALRAFAADHLDRAALPRQLLTVDSLPHLASGKPDRQALRSLVPAVNDLRT